MLLFLLLFARLGSGEYLIGLRAFVEYYRCFFFGGMGKHGAMDKLRRDTGYNSIEKSL
jgi:hypothetical protein